MSDPIVMTFADVGDFQAFYAAERWCKENGYSVGSMQGPDPIGLLRGDFAISKWRNLSRQQRAELDGQMTGDMRSGPITIRVKA
jgi:hypothetical protein